MTDIKEIKDLIGVQITIKKLNGKHFLLEEKSVSLKIITSLKPVIFEKLTCKNLLLM